jgi:tetratricopeptide (TPR) repeat protein
LDWVDEICLIDTGIRDNTLQKSRLIAGEKLTQWSFPWCNDFAAARNAAIQAADERQATWAMTLDTDERMEFPGYRDQQQLLQALESSPEVISWMIPIREGSYVKERFIRLPTRLNWQGRTHEALVGAGPTERRVLSGCCFWEVAKSAEDFEHKMQRDLAILLDECAAHPLSARWWYYLGQTYEGMQHFRQAVQAFEQCIRIDDWADESSWACYMAARCLVAIKEFREAEEYCALGMSRKPTMAELPWLAGWCCFQRGALADAVSWSRLAITLSQNTSARNEAIFKYMPAWYEGPYDVLRYAYQSLDEPRLCQQAEVDFENAQARRLKDLELQAYLGNSSSDSLH